MQSTELDLKLDALNRRVKRTWRVLYLIWGSLMVVGMTLLGILIAGS